jgi:hypothetical protein
MPNTLALQERLLSYLLLVPYCLGTKVSFYPNPCWNQFNIWKNDSEPPVSLYADSTSLDCDAIIAGFKRQFERLQIPYRGHSW